jgi:ketosteroid isomerase-like protein
MRVSIFLFAAGLLLTPDDCYSQSAQAQRAHPEESLDTVVFSLDTALFDAVNHCELSKVGSFFAADAEFLHDRASPLYGREAIVASIRENLCGKVQREIVPGSIEVYPLKDYGAVQIGIHRFLHPGSQDHGVVGEAKFVHVWKHEPDGWKITRVISYAHGTVQNH